MRNILIAAIGVALGMGLSIRPAGAGTVTLDFAGLGGANGDPFTSFTEGGYTITATSGDWLVAQAYGNPIPDIYLGPVGSPLAGSIEVTGPSPFTFDSVDFSANNGAANYSMTGNGGVAFTQTGTEAGVFGPYTFTTVSSTSATGISTLDIKITPGAGETSFNIDNIVLGTPSGSAVPLPATSWCGFGLLGGLGVLMLARRRKLATPA